MASTTIDSSAGAPSKAAQPPVAAAATASTQTEYPGRWVGGLIGALASLAAAPVASALSAAPTIFDWDSWSPIALLGMPVAFALGRALLPVGRSGGWSRALSTGMLVGLIAPPLGAVEVLAGSRLLDVGNLNTSIGGPVALVLLPVAIPISFIAIFMTLPVGIVWGILVRLVPDRAFAAVRVPRPLERLGVRHAVVAVGAALILLEIGVRS
ncbi:MAG: hypothetical protein QOF49_1032 [Chloroflexota bacterium]|jgi:hypothetical protein|nr:hypothetical protein [Chloroflexota bacterium]